MCSTHGTCGDTAAVEPTAARHQALRRLRSTQPSARRYVTSQRYTNMVFGTQCDALVLRPHGAEVNAKSLSDQSAMPHAQHGLIDPSLQAPDMLLTGQICGMLAAVRRPVCAGQIPCALLRRNVSRLHGPLEHCGRRPSAGRSVKSRMTRPSCVQILRAACPPASATANPKGVRPFKRHSAARCRCPPSSRARQGCSTSRGSRQTTFLVHVHSISKSFPRRGVHSGCSCADSVFPFQSRAMSDASRPCHALRGSRSAWRARMSLPL